MSDPTVKLPDEVKTALREFVKKRLGLLGALHFKHEVEKCPCEPCQTLREMVSDNI